MTTILIIIGIAFLLSEFGKGAKSKRIKREQERIREEQARIKEEQKRQKEWAKAETARRIAIEREQIAQRKEQERQAAEMERMKHVLAQATADIDFLQDRTADLYAQLDYQLLLQAGTVPGSKQFEKYQSKIVTLKNQIHTAENKLNKAQWNRNTAQRKLA